MSDSPDTCERKPFPERKSCGRDSKISDTCGRGLNKNVAFAIRLIKP